MSELEPKDERLQRAIDDSLRRVFTAPHIVEVPAVDELVAPSREPVKAAAGSLLDWWPLAGIAAACLALVLYLVDEESHGNPKPTTTAGGGLERAPELASPDLDIVYREAEQQGVAAPLDTTAALCGLDELQVDDGLLATLEHRYGQRLKLSPRTRRGLLGPFRSVEWPTALLFVAFPVDAGGRPVVLVAESEANHRCCIDPAAPRRRDLRAFIWMVGKVHLTEITPLEEPLYLQEFEEEIQ